MALAGATKQLQRAPGIALAPQGTHNWFVRVFETMWPLPCCSAGRSFSCKADLLRRCMGNTGCPLLPVGDTGLEDSTSKEVRRKGEVSKGCMRRLLPVRGTGGGRLTSLLKLTLHDLE